MTPGEPWGRLRFKQLAFRCLGLGEMKLPCKVLGGTGWSRVSLELKCKGCCLNSSPKRFLDSLSGVVGFNLNNSRPLQQFWFRTELFSSGPIITKNRRGLLSRDVKAMPPGETRRAQNPTQTNVWSTFKEEREMKEM